MKKARYLPMGALGLVVMASAARADNAGSSDSSNPYGQADPDGVPVALDMGRPKQPSQADIEEARQQQARAAQQKDWLVRSYEAQLKARAQSDPSADQDSNLYYQLSSNPDMAKLAGLTALDPNNSPADQNGATVPKRATDSMQSDAAQSAKRPFAPGYVFKPLITPFSAPGAVVRDYYASLPVAMPSPLFTDSAPKPAESKRAQSPDSADIETPGMIAAGNDAASDADNLSLDILPGETIEQARQRQDDTKLELPLPMTADELHKRDLIKLAPPSATKQTTPTTAAAAPAKNVPLEDPDEPIPISRQPIITPIRAPIANPYDILDR
jgi:hypothetical protein